jgi:hypothetical protein
MIIKMTAAQLSRWISFGYGAIRSISGYNANTDDVYLQLFESSKVNSGTVVANGTAPTLGSLLCSSINGFKYDFGTYGMTCKELCIACSSTQSSLTLVGAAAGLDMTIDVAGDFLVDQYPNISVIGDLTTLQASLSLWSEGSGPQTLARLDVVAGVGTINYLVGYAVTTPSASNKVQFAVPVSTTGAGNFGYGGFSPFEKTADQVIHQGCKVQCQADTAPAANTGQTFAVRAIMI